MGAWQGLLWIKHKAEWSYVKSSARSISLGLQAYYADHAEYPENLAVLVSQDYLTPSVLHLNQKSSLKYLCPATNATESTIVLEVTFFNRCFTLNKDFNETVR